MDHHLHSTQELPFPIEPIFAFFEQAENLGKLTPKGMSFQLLTPTPVTMRQGTLIDYRLSLFGLPLRWTSEITRYDPPHCFVDEQLRGPYKLWVHTHSFEPSASGTLVRDHVRYRLPLFPLGELVYPLIRFQLGRIFAYRRTALQKLLLG